MRNPEIVLNNLVKHSNDSSYKFERLYRILFSEEMFYVAYQRIYAKPGNMTAGTDGQTIDQMSIQRIERLIESLKDETYQPQPQPARRVYIPKKNGKKRPLGIPAFEDKLVQEVTRMVLEAIYEGHFIYTSHGFRPNKSCHTALTHIQDKFTGVKWFIEGDIKGFFDNIDHSILVNILKERIGDERFLRLIRKFLKAGYMEFWRYHNTYSGTPQGGIISPLLANIYLDKFDKYMREYSQNFDKGERRRISTEYRRINNKRTRLTKKLKTETDESVRVQMMDEIQETAKEMFSTPCSNAMDEQYRRLKYVRYADDFLIGVIGNKAECVKIKEDIAQFMTEKLKLELSAEKTLITNAQNSAKFLGYEIFIRKSEAKHRDKRGILRRFFSGAVMLHVDSETAKKKLLDYDAMRVAQVNGKIVWKPKPRSFMIGGKVEDIVAQYNTEIRGFYNYYSIANNISTIGGSFGYIMEYSMYKTIAQKLNLTMSQAKLKYLTDKNFIVPFKDSKGQTKYRVFYNGGFKRKTASWNNVYDNIPSTWVKPKLSLIERLKEEHCELCGTKGRTVMFHVRNLNDAERAILINKIKEVQKRKHQIPASDEMDENYRRLKYIRYADDFLIGVIGSKEEAKRIKEDIKNFLADKLALELSEEKTLITHTEKAAKFLGYEISVSKDKSTLRDTKGRLRRSRNKRLQLTVSINTIRDKLLEYGAIQIVNRNGTEVWKPKQRAYLIYNDDLEILERYNAEIRGFSNYFSIAGNSALLHKFKYNMEYSMYKTFAGKYRSSVRKIANKYRLNGDFTVSYVNKDGVRRYRRFYYDGFKRKNPLADPNLDTVPNTVYCAGRTSLVDRLQARKCELCGETNNLNMHHIRKLGDLKGKEPWERMMIARRRKTLAVCEKCHRLIHSGKLQTDNVGGEPDTRRRVSPVRRRAFGNLPQECDKAPDA